MESRESVPLDALSSPVLQDGWTPLHIASDNGHLEVVRLLLDQGADMEATIKVGAVRRWRRLSVGWCQYSGAPRSNGHSQSLALKPLGFCVWEESSGGSGFAGRRRLPVDGHGGSATTVMAVRSCPHPCTRLTTVLLTGIGE
jgi:hypothetical protein